MDKKLLITFAILIVIGGILFVVYIQPDTKYERSAEIEAVEGCPPAPNFFEPIDYVEWLNNQYAIDKPQNLSKPYSRFWPEPMSSNDGFPKPPRDIHDKLIALSTGPEWKPTQYPNVNDYLDSVAPMIEIFKDEVENARGYRFIPKPGKLNPRNPIYILLPKIDGSRYVIPCLLSLAWRSGGNHQKSLLETWKLGLRHATHLQQSNQLLLIRIGMTIRLLVYTSMRAAASNNELNQQGIRNTLQLLDDIDPGPPDIHESIRIEWGGTLGFVQALYPQGHLNHELAEMIGYAGGQSPRFVDSEQVYASRISPAQLVKSTDEHYVVMLGIAENPVSLHSFQKLRNLDMANFVGILRNHPLRPSIQPILKLVFREAIRCSASRRGTRLVFDVLAHFDTYGLLPKELTEICDNSLQRTDPGSSKDFIYRVSDQSTRNGFVLYSVGEDGINDDGRHGPWGDLYKQTIPTECDFVFWPFQRD